MNRIGSTRKTALLGGSALMLVLFASQAHAQCTTTGADFTAFTPFATSGTASVNSIVSVLNTTTTAFFNQTNAFIGAPPNPQPNQMGGGIWGRGVGGRVDTEANGLVTGGLVGGADFVGNVNCNTTTRTEFTGYQVGADLARLNVGGWNLHGGVTAGYVEADSTDLTPGAGTFRSNIQVPFAGIYGAATLGSFYVDAQLRWDHYQGNATDPSNGIFNQGLDARGVAFAANAGYNIQLGNNWFIEPSGGIVWSRVEVDPLNVSGTFILANNNGIAPPGVLQISDIESLLGRLSVRVGTTFTAGNFLLQPFATASLFHEFEGNVTTTFVSDFSAIGLGFLPDVRGALSTSRIGTYGQLSLGIAGLLQNTGWLGYTRFDYRTGENVEGWSLSGGLRYQFTPAAIAAPVAPVGKGPVFKAPPAPVVVAYNWTGFYIGAYAGATWGDSDWTFVGIGTTTDPRFAGAAVGGQVGFNYQVGSWVFGVEGDIGWANAKGAKACPNGFFFTCQTHVDQIAMVTGRVGYASDRSLFYVKGGFATADVELQTHFNPQSQPLLIGLLVPPCAGPVTFGQFGFQASSTCPVERASRNASGWTVGAGFEFGLTDNWSARGEYMYYDLGTERYALPSGAVDADLTGNLVRVGLNYRWNPFAGR
jgi:opacity protein-like surface antigen